MSRPAARPLRRHLVGLPIQRSTFDELGTAASLIGLADALPGGEFPAHLDADGALRVDPDGIEALRRAFPAHPDAAFLAHLEETRESRYRDLLELVAAGAVKATPTPDDVARLLAAVARTMPYPLLTKVVPDLLAAAAEREVGDVPLPRQPSPGALLTEDLGALSGWCTGRGHPPEALVDRWPPPAPDVVATVESFCRRHVGFGPVAWEAPGFDSVSFTLRAMTGADAVATATPPPDRRHTDFVRPHPSPPATIGDVVVRWVEHMDLQIWYLRDAFYRGLVPLLRGVARRHGVAPWRLLFIERHEFGARLPPAPEMDRRVSRYLSRTGYLAAHGIDLDRLEAIFGAEERQLPRLHDVPEATERPVPGQVLHGTAAAPGVAVGPAHVMSGGAPASLPAGSVVVVPVLHPYLAPVLASAVAVVVEEGGLLQHATVLAREFGIPAVTAVRDATRLIASGVWVRVDGDAGRVGLIGGGSGLQTTESPG